MLLDLSDVSRVKAFSDNVLVKALQSMTNLYLQICSWNFILHVYKINWGSFKLYWGKQLVSVAQKVQFQKPFSLFFNLSYTIFLGTPF